MTEQEIFGKLVDGDSAAWASLASKLRRLLRSWHPPRCLDIEELLTDILSMIFQELPSLRAPGSFFAFAWTIARRTVHQAHAKTRPCHSGYLRSVASRDPVENVLEAREVLEVMRASLSAADREVFELHFVRELNGIELARELGISPEAARTRASRVRKACIRLATERGFVDCFRRCVVPPVSPGRGCARVEFRE